MRKKVLCIFLYYNYMVCNLSEEKKTHKHFAHFFLAAKSFLTKFRNCQEDYYEEDIVKLASVTHKEHVEINDLMLTLRLVELKPIETTALFASWPAVHQSIFSLPSSNLDSHFLSLFQEQ